MAQMPSGDYWGRINRVVGGDIYGRFMSFDCGHCCLIGRSALQKELDALLKLPPRQQHSPIATVTTQADVSTQPDHSPLIATARVRLA